MTTSALANNDAAEVLIVTAVKEEWDAVLKVDTEAEPGSMWETKPGAAGLGIAHRRFMTPRGLLRIAVTQALGMGGVAAVNAAAPLIDPLGVQCLAMCGVCAGRRGKVELGDVIIADRLWTYDAGKSKVSKDAKGRRKEHEEGDIEMHLLKPAAWRHAAERFRVDEKAPWLADQPRSYDAQGQWLLERLAREENPAEHDERPAMCNDFPTVVVRLRVKGWVQKDKIALTTAGRKHIAALLETHPDGLPKPRRCKTLVGPIATGTKVKEDPEIFANLARSERTVLGLEMEADAIGALAHLRGIERSVVMKAVMDFADGDKNDHFKEFAARASAECLIAFLRENVPPRGEKWLDDYNALLKQNKDAKDAYDDAYTEAKESTDFWAHGASFQKKTGYILVVLGLVGALLSSLFVRDLDASLRVFCWLSSAMFLLTGIGSLVEARRDQKKKTAREEMLRKFPQHHHRGENE